MSVLRLNVLGPPEVYQDGRRLTFALRKAQALLLYLAVEGGLHPRSKLAALLWPDSESHAACTALRNALTLLRSLLADPNPSTAPDSLPPGQTSTQMARTPDSYQYTGVTWGSPRLSVDVSLHIAS